MASETANAPKIQFRLAGSDDAELWDAFVTSHPEGRFCHLWAYRQTLINTYGYKCLHSCCMVGDVWVGIFPSIVVKRHSGRLISQPFQEYGGPLLAETALPYAESIAKSLVELAEKQGCKSVEIRGGVGCEPLTASPYCIKHPLYQYAELGLADKDFLWKKSMVQEARKGVNKATESGLNCEIRRGTESVSRDFYRLYLESMKRLGVPPHPQRFFSEMAQRFGDQLVASWVQLKGKDVAVLLAVACGKRIQAYITASEPEYWNMRPNDLAHWELMLWSFANGLKIFDFGSARYPGQIHYKKKWGSKFYDYNYYLLGQPGSPEIQTIQAVNSSSDTMTKAAKAWEKYMPIPLTKVFGPPIRKYLTK